MPNDPLTEKSILSLQKGPKWTPTAPTIIYVILFPFLFYMALLSSMVSDNPSITPFFVGLIMFVVFLIPQIAKALQNRNKKKFKATVYLTEEAEKAFTELYIHRLRKDRKIDRSMIACDAIQMLFEKECGMLSN